MRFLRRSPRNASAAQTVVQGDAAGAPPVVEEEERPPPPPPPPRPLIWPWLLLLLLLVIGGLLAAWFLTRDNDDHKKSSPTTVTTTSTVSPTPVSVPDVVGKNVSVAVPLLRGNGLKVDRTSVASTKAAGVVISQKPIFGTRVAKGSTVLINVSRGVVQVPNVVGQSRSNAVTAIRHAHLVPKAFIVSSTRKKGTVVAQRPLGGTHVSRGSTVRLNLSNGHTTGVGPPPPPPPPPSPLPPPPPPPAPKTVSVPDVTGEQQASAQRQLNSKGFKAGVVYVPSDQPQGTVVSQSPAGGLTRRRGTRIQLNASLGPNPGPQQSVPNVVGMTLQQARARLTSAGFRVQQLARKVSVRSQDGRIVDEQPAGGRRIPASATVVIYVGKF